MSILASPTHPLHGLSPFVYGTTRLGDAAIPFAERVRTARAAMEHGVWFHTSHQYGDALAVLRAAFDEDRARVPRLIFKIGWKSVDEVRSTIESLTRTVGVEHMDIGQLCLDGDLARDFAEGGPSVQALHQLRGEGRVGRFLLQVFPWTSQVALAALRAGHARGLIDGYIFYLNPLQRFATNPLWDLLQETRSPIVAMRTVAGGDVHALRDVPGAAWKDYLRRGGALVRALRGAELAGVLRPFRARVRDRLCHRRIDQQGRTPRRARRRRPWSTVPARYGDHLRDCKATAPVVR